METNNILNANLTEKTPETANIAVNATGVATMVPQETQRINVLSELLKEQIEQNQSKINADKIESELNFESQVKIAAEQKEEKIIEQKIELEDEQKAVEKEELKKEEQIVEQKESQKEENVKENSSDNTIKNNTRGRDCRLEKLLLARINAMQGKIKESLELIKKFEKINAKEEHLPNIVTTLRDKLTQEVIVQCRTVGIEFNMNSYLVQSIVSDLLSIFEEGITEFKECSENLTFVKEVQDDIESRVELAPTNKVRNLISRLRGLFKPENKQKVIEDKERERQENKLEQANIHLIKYKYLNNELSKYTIRKNIVESLTKEMLYGKDSSKATIQDFIQERIAPEMKQLGLQYLMPVLNEEINKECTKKIGAIESDKLQQISISDIKKSIKVGEYISTEPKPEGVKEETEAEI